MTVNQQQIQTDLTNLQGAQAALAVAQAAVVTAQAAVASAQATLQTDLAAFLATPAPAPAPAPTPALAPSFPAPIPAADENGHPITYATPTPALGSAMAQTGGAVQIAFPTGQTFVFNESAGVSRGTYQGQFVQQSSVEVTRSDAPFTVHFRRDVNAKRLEVVVELGRLFGAQNAAAANAPAYTATIYDKGVQVAQEAVPFHWWFSRWRWQQSPRPLVRTKEAVAALYPKFAPSTAPLVATALNYRFPMDNAAGPGQLLYQMGTVGDRNEIGLLTEPQAAYLITGDQIALQSLLAQAETSGSVPWHMRDENTGAPVDFLKHPVLHWYPHALGDAGEEWVKTVTSMWSPNAPHLPSLSFVAYMLTDDPYHLEELQFQMGWHIGWTDYHRLTDGAVNGVPQPVINPSETREWAWGIRTLFQNTKVAPASPPSWLLGQPYYTQLLSVNGAYFDRVLTNPTDAAMTGFHLPLQQNIIVPWMLDYLLMAFAQGIVLGFSDWQSRLDWTSMFRKSLCSDTGWSPQWFAPYEIEHINGNGPDDFAGVTPGDMAGLWASFVKNHNIDLTKFPPAGTWAQSAVSGQSYGYATWARATLNVLAKLGDPQANTCLTNVGAMADAVTNKAVGGYPYRWSFAPN